MRPKAHQSHGCGANEQSPVLPNASGQLLPLPGNRKRIYPRPPHRGRIKETPKAKFRLGGIFLLSVEEHIRAADFLPNRIIFAVRLMHLPQGIAKIIIFFHKYHPYKKDSNLQEKTIMKKMLWNP